jgi:raffinose/stachyose/melibiose transport system substrate-binding protein
VNSQNRTRRLLIVLLLVLVTVSWDGGALHIAAKQSEPATVTMWLETGGGAETANCVIANAIDPFNAAHPDIQVQATEQANSYEATRTALAGGAGPDIVSTPGPSEGIALAQAGLLLPLDDYAKKFGWDETMAPWSLSLGAVDGKLYSLPSEVETLVLYYNKTLFDEHGWQVPKTLDELMALAQAVSDAGIIPFAHSNADFRRANEFYVDEVLNHGPGAQKFYDALTGKAHWTDPEFVSAIELLNQMQQNGWFMGSLDDYYTASYAETGAALGDGDAAMRIDGTWFLEGIDDFFGETAGNSNDWGWAPVPTTTGDVLFDLGLGSTYSINKNAKNPDATAEVLNFFFSPETQAKLTTNCGLAPAPVSLDPDVLAGLDPRVAKLRQDLSEASAAGNYGYTTWTFFPAATDTYLAETIERVWSGEMTPQDYLQGMQSSFDEEVARGALPPVPAR